MRYLFVLALACGGCGPEPPLPDAGDAETPACGTGPGELEVGRGGSRPVALPRAGGELPIVLGAQGGIHVVVGAWVRDLDLELELRYRLERDGARVGEETVQRLDPSLFAPDGDRFVRHPDLIVLDNETPRVEDFAGLTVTLSADALSSDGSHACDSREVRLVAPP